LIRWDRRHGYVRRYFRYALEPLFNPLAAVGRTAASTDDVLIAEQAAGFGIDHENHPISLHALLLGVTPEIATMNWPPLTRLTAADREPGMLSSVWPGNTQNRVAVCADWLSLPFTDHAFNFVIGDGCLILMDYSSACRQFTASLLRCMTQNGRLMLRTFCRPEQPEQVTDIAEALRRHNIKSFDTFKLRLMMAIQQDDVAHGVCLAEVWRAWQSLEPDPVRFALEQDWPLPKVLMIDAYRDNPGRYYFPTLAEVRALFARDFEEISCHFGQYELAERCPNLLLKPR
jgi:hypothetical protein